MNLPIQPKPNTQPQTHAPAARTPSYDRIPTDILLPALRPKSTEPATDDVTYYGRPMVKPPTWKWPIPLYFWLGGIAGGSALIGGLADLFGGERHRATVRNARYLTLALGMICPIPLIEDLGRPMRFFRMLRVFKISSPLSVGTWILSAFGLTSGILATRQATEDLPILRRSPLGAIARLIPTKPLSALHALLGLGLGGYTGTLLAVTAIPVWAAAGILLGPLFLATAIASGAAALAIMSVLTKNNNPCAVGELEAIETAASLTELGVILARERLVTPTINAPLRSGRWGALFRFGAVGAGIGGPLTLRIANRLVGQRAPRLRSALTVAGASLTLLGALAERFAITEAGKVSARDPLAYQELTRGTPGEARPTPAAQAHRAPTSQKFGVQIAARDTR